MKGRQGTTAQTGPQPSPVNIPQGTYPQAGPGGQGTTAQTGPQPSPVKGQDTTVHSPAQ